MYRRPSRHPGLSGSLLAGASGWAPDADDAGAGEFAVCVSPSVCVARVLAQRGPSRRARRLRDVGPGSPVLVVQNRPDRGPAVPLSGEQHLVLGDRERPSGVLDWRDHLGHGALLDLLLGQPVDRSGFRVETEARCRVRHARGPHRPRREASRGDVSRAIRDSRWGMAVTMVPAGAGCDGSRLGHARDAAAVAGGRSPRVALSSATRSTAAEVLILARPSRSRYGRRGHHTTSSGLGTTQPPPAPWTKIDMSQTEIGEMEDSLMSRRTRVI